MSPDFFRGREGTHSMQQILEWAMNPCTEDVMDELLEMGREDAQKMVDECPVLSGIAAKARMAAGGNGSESAGTGRDAVRLRVRG